MHSRVAIVDIDIQTDRQTDSTEKKQMHRQTKLFSSTVSKLIDKDRWKDIIE